ncbi:Kinase, NEK [Giardia muris]|uniref:non-specific serine/threonine protein kinase n=1 Tax=Giardia muris TaxID=5742 RepID=A0A4Z1SVQ8_GIAMU|nr:Kinase, NEK [Giardia muris]|eukprot:TNJ27668.1 Kinase, NEK [Giardia muris]
MENYVVERKIGEGSFGECYLCTHKATGQHVVIKEICIADMAPEELENTRRESSLLLQLRHPNVVHCLEAFDEAPFYYIVMNYCKEGELTRLIKDRSKSRIPFEEPLILRWVAQLASALWYIHDQKMIHRDLKTQNVFLDEHLNLQIGDFGVARTIGPGSLATTFVGSPLYMSPELIEEKKYNSQSDMWSLGCIIFEMLCLKTAFQARNMNMLIIKILSNQIPELPPMYSQELQEMCYNLLKQSPTERMTAAQLCSHRLIRPLIEEMGLPHPEWDGVQPTQPKASTATNAFVQRRMDKEDKLEISLPIENTDSNIARYLQQSIADQEHDLRVERPSNLSPAGITKTSRLRDEPHGLGLKLINNPIVAYQAKKLMQLVDQDVRKALCLLSAVQTGYMIHKVDFIEAVSGVTIPDDKRQAYEVQTNWADDSCRAWDAEAAVYEYIFEKLAGPTRAQACLQICRHIVALEQFST